MKKDQFENIHSIREWDYYVNGEDPNNTEYMKQVKLWNTTVTNGQGYKLFEGDLSQERLDFLKRLSKNDTTFYIFWEHEGYEPLKVHNGLIFGTQTFLMDCLVL